MDLSQEERLVKLQVDALFDPSFGDRVNSDLDSLPLKNGKLINLRTGVVRDRVMTDLFTFECPVTYLVDDAPCPNAKLLFEYAFRKDVELIDYVQQLMGYLITGYACEDNMYFLYGPEGDIMKMSSGIFIVMALSQILGEFSAGWNPNLEAFRLEMLRGHRLISILDPNGVEAMKLVQDGRIFSNSNKTPKMTKFALLVNQPPAPGEHISSLRLPTSPDKLGKAVPVYLRKCLDEIFTLVARGARRWYQNGCKLKPPGTPS